MNSKISALLMSGACLVTFAACSSGTSLTVTTSNNDRTESTAPLVTATEETASDDTVTDETSTDETSTDETVVEISIPDISIPDISIPDISIPDITIPDLTDLTVPGSVSSEDLESCTLFGQIFGQVFTGEGSGTDDLDASLDKIEGDLPEEYQADFDALSEGLTTLQPLFDKYGSDYTKIVSDPIALQVYSDPDFLSALTNLQGYFATKCGIGSIGG